MSWFLNENQLLRYTTQRVWQNRYYEANYIEFDWKNNGGWIDVGLPSYTNSVWYVDFEYIEVSNENWVAGGANLAYNVACICGTANGTGWYTDTGVSYDRGFGTGVRIRGTFNANGRNYTAPYNVYIGCRNWSTEGSPISPSNANPSHFKVYGFYMSQNSVVQRQMYPAYDSVNEEWGMYDTVTDTFFGNAGGANKSIAGGYMGDFNTTPLVLDYSYEDRNKSDWYMTDSDLITADIIPRSLSWEPPYPVGVWYMNEYLELKAGGIPDRLRWEKPYPYSVWYYAYDMDHVFDSAIPELLEITYGAFTGCTNLTKIKFARSLLSIGKYSCTGTDLTSVTIPEDCTYYETTFPPGCEVHTFPTT